MSDRVAAATLRLPASPRIRGDAWVVLVAASAVAAGLVAAIHPAVAVAFAAAAVLAPVVVVRPIVGLWLLVLLSYLEPLAAFGGGDAVREPGDAGSNGITATKLIGLLLVGAWVAKIATSAREGRSEPGLLARRPVLVAALVLFSAWVAVSMVWADQPGSAREAAMRFGLNFVLFPIALLAVRNVRHVVWLYSAFVAGAITSAVLGLLFGTALDPTEEGRLKGLGLNPNQLGELLIIATIFGVVLAARKDASRLSRCIAGSAGAVSAIFLCMTLSRGALLGLAAALLVSPFVVGRGRRLAAVALVAAALVATVGWFATVAPPQAVDRVTNPERSGGSGRTDLWRIGWRMVEDRPLTGVGAGNYQAMSIHYHLRPGRTNDDDLIVDRPRVVHNIYLNVLSELGIVGLTLFAAIIAACLAAALRAARIFERRGDVVMELLSRGLLIALVGHLASLFFSSMLYGKQLWLLLALAPALLAIAERTRSRDRATASLTPARQLAHARPGA